MRGMKSSGSLLVVTAALLSCSLGGITEEDPNATRTFITDGPFPFERLSRVDLYVVSVSASLNPDTTAGSGGVFVTIAAPHRKINILALANGIVDELGDVTLTSGAITAVRMVIDTDSSSITLKTGQVLMGSTTPGIAWQSSAGRPTLNALIAEQILVPDTGALIVIDFDIGKAFIPPQEIDPLSTDSGFIFSPVFRAVDANRTGNITGTVHAHTAAGAAVADASISLYLGNPSNPENTWSKLQTVKTAANGQFRLAFVTRSSYWAALPAHAGESYIVAVDPPASAGLGRALVAVTGGVTALSTNALGAVVLP